VRKTAANRGRGTGSGKRRHLRHNTRHTSITMATNNSSLASRSTVYATAAAFVLAGCAQKGPQAARDEPCNPVVGAVVGGAIGALVGGEKRRTGGALVGAGLGALACIGYNYKTRQTRSAEQVGDDYKRANNNQLPPAPVVTAYRTETKTVQARGGDEVTVVSNIEVVPGAKQPLKELREEFAIVDPEGNERSKITKIPAPAGSAGGAYVSTLLFTFPKGVPAGAYQVQSKLYVNGQPARTGSVKIQVAAGAAGPQPLVVVAGAMAPRSF
jgi:hypothetical protein